MKLPFWIALLAAVASSPAAAEASAQTNRCYVALVHGSGESHHDEVSGERAAGIESYWRIEDRADTAFGAALAGQGETACVIWYVGYDGIEQWWSQRAAGRVAVAINDFIAKYSIPDGGLTVIGHSMGGLVARYVINNGMPAAPYYNEYAGLDPRMDYDLVRRKTGRLITLQTPHTGTQSADALFGDADHSISNGGAGVIKILGWREVTPAVGTMTRAYMEAAGARGGEMGDEGRVLPMQTVAGVDSGDSSGTGMDNDGKLDSAWILLCYKRGAANSWGAACRWDVWNFEAVPGDGLVEHRTSHGLWLRGSPNGAPGILGARQPWLDVVHNHNHGRYNLLVATIINLTHGFPVLDRLGSYLGKTLP